MKTKDFIFNYPAPAFGGDMLKGCCRVRMFDGAGNLEYIVITDLGREKSPGSITNNIEHIIAHLKKEKIFVGHVGFVQHYEGRQGEGEKFDFVVLDDNKSPVWCVVDRKALCLTIKCGEEEFKKQKKGE